MNPVDLADLRARVQQALADFLGEQRGLLNSIDPALDQVAGVIESFVLGGGKRLRPAFAYWGCRGAGGPDTPALICAVAALELVQASALMHDDVMDGSDTRRGEPSVHRRFAARHRDLAWQGDPAMFGSSSAILLGDLCLAWSDEILGRSGLPAVTVQRARADFDLMRTEVIAGQYLDVQAQASGDGSLRRAMTVARYKSAKYTVERPLLFGAAIAGNGAGVRSTYSEYGLPLGEAFQLRDDVLGVFGDPARTGKPAGDDLREGKRTYLIAQAFTTTDPDASFRLRERLGDPDLDDAGVAELRAIIAETGALARTEERIANLTATALTALSHADLANGAGKVLADLAEAATDRTY